jgi:NADH:ubiquinone oxidoreductase subunit 5 (subunit L)/multisubunit Na+/H+ antiporter MnhA subunit
MAGIFSLYNLEVRFGLNLLLVALFSLFVVVLIARPETDFKRLIAASTVVMVGFIWVIFLGSFSGTALTVCAIHAGYKSGIFLVTGKLLSRAGTYVDSIFTTTADRTYLALIGIFLVACRTSAYSSAKHQLDCGTLFAVSDFFLQGVLAASLVLVWFFAARLQANAKSPAGFSGTDGLLVSMLLSIFSLAFWLLGGSGYAHSTVVTLLIALVLKATYRTGLNFGSIGFSTSWVSATFVKFNFVKALVFAGNLRLNSLSTWLLTGLLLGVLVDA